MSTPVLYFKGLNPHLSKSFSPIQYNQRTKLERRTPELISSARSHPLTPFYAASNLSTTSGWIYYTRMSLLAYRDLAEVASEFMPASSSVVSKSRDYGGTYDSFSFLGRPTFPKSNPSVCRSENPVSLRSSSMQRRPRLKTWSLTKDI